MITYKYAAMAQDGTQVKGVVEALDEYAAVDQIKAQYPVVLKLTPIKDKEENILNKDINRKLDEKALSVMCSQFSTILEAGVDVATAMEMIGKQIQDRKLKKMLLNGSKDVRQGNSVAVSMEKNCDVLPVTFVETIKAGELSGTLEQSFVTMEAYYKKNYKLKQKIKQALTYPIFVVVIAIVVVAVVVGFVMPTISSIFDDLEGELPGITKGLLAVTNFLHDSWYIIFGFIAILYVAYAIYTHTEKGRITKDSILLKLPVLGKIAKSNACADFATTMSALLEAGLPMPKALETTSKVLNNKLFSQETYKLIEKVETGVKLGDAMKNDEVFPETLTEMTAVGENTGELEKTLRTIGDYYMNESDVATEAAISRLEPTLLILLAIFAGLIVFAIYMPLFTMYNYM